MAVTPHLHNGREVLVISSIVREDEHRLNLDVVIRCRM